MKKLAIASLALVTLFAAGVANQANAERGKRTDKWAQRFARTRSWHGDYAHTAHGRPVALVVPPTAQMQGSMGWGVTGTEMRPIYHQFRRPFPGYVEGDYGQQFSPTPNWPSHSDQMGVYYIRGPW